MEKFLRNILNIDDYNIVYFNSWKNNITAKVSCVTLGDFVVQKEWGALSEKAINLISQTIPYFSQSSIILAGNKFEHRFYDSEGDTYQVLDYVDGITLSDLDVDIEVIENTAKYLARFHQISQNVRSDNIEKSNTDYK